VSGGKSLKEQLFAIFGKKFEKLDSTVQKPIPPQPSSENEVSGEETAPARDERDGKKRRINAAAVRERLLRAARSKIKPGPTAATERAQSQPIRPKRPTAVPAPAVAPPPAAERPTPWQPPREKVLLADTFGAVAAGPLIEESRTPILARSIAGVSSVFKRREERPQVQVGLDFGTSSTKAMWARLQVPDSEVRAIDFGHELDGMPSYCLPSLAAFDRRGNLALGDTALRVLTEDGVQFALTRFKMLLAGGVDPRYLDTRNQEIFAEHVRTATGDEQNCTPEMLTVVYLAFAMRRIRRQLEGVLKRDDIDVSFNTCVPVDQRAHNAVYDRFDKVIGAAERLERHARHARDGDSARTWLEQAGVALVDGPLHKDERRLFLVPEAVAGTAAYVSSLRRDSGLHALIDIGAGTTDVSIFNLSLPERGEATSFWYSARSVPYGAGHIEARTRHVLKENGRAGTLPQVRAVLAGERDGLTQITDLLRDELDSIRRRTNGAWTEAYGHNKLESEWTGKKVKVFLAGGGALIPEARDVFCESWVRKWGPYPCASMPDPETYDPQKVGGPFVRISVAFGLTTPIPVLGRWVMPADSPNHTPPPAPVRSWERGGDQLVPGPGWS